MENFERKDRTDELMGIYAPKLGYNKDQIDFIKDVMDTVKSVMEKHNVRNKAIEWDHIGSRLIDGKVIPPPGFEDVLFELIRDNEIIRTFIPEKHGGFGFSGYMTAPITEVTNYYSQPMGMMAYFALTVLEPLYKFYRPEYDEIIERFAVGKNIGYGAFTEAHAGSNLKSINSTSELVGDEYVLNGTKIFITNGGYANAGLFLAKNMVNGKDEGTNVFLVEGLEGITTLRLEEKSGIHASPTAQLHFNNVTVPKENLLGEAGNGYHKVIERLLGMRMSVAVQASAAAKRAYDEALVYAQTREQFNRPIINFPDIQKKLTIIKTQIERLEDFAHGGYYALERFHKGLFPSDQYGSDSQFPDELHEGLIHHYISGAKIYSSEVVNFLMYDAAQIFGGMGFISETIVNKLTRDVRILSIYDGTSEIQKWILSRSKKAIDHLPNFQSPYSKYQDSTIYEEMLFLRFPELRELI
ncbi:MAG: acyl-CoA/acyl-ACP dehydrogenase [Candidatus Heimdallarchaeota archaeon]|nr:acyl-CoA/acyl-ACP dehydrogenase [Candidatus Heimdallarchaeota archaeon]MDH5645169.1 acyl-CoA/acyl-ACP dehydrogenase [Candidatus Heimdallarchaeota archaeon]